MSKRNWKKTGTKVNTKRRPQAVFDFMREVLKYDFYTKLISSECKLNGGHLSALFMYWNSAYYTALNIW